MGGKDGTTSGDDVSKQEEDVHSYSFLFISDDTAHFRRRENGKNTPLQGSRKGSSEVCTRKLAKSDCGRNFRGRYSTIKYRTERLGGPAKSS